MADNLIKISELQPTTQLKSADIIPISQDGETRSIKGAVLEQKLLDKTDARYIENSKKGQPNGVATLNAQGEVVQPVQGVLKPSDIGVTVAGLDSEGKVLNSNIKFGSVAEGDSNVVSGGEVWESIKDYSSGIKPIDLSSEKPSQDGIFQPIEVGVYPNYGNLELTQEEKDSSIVYLYLINGIFSKEVKSVSITDTIEPNNTNAVSSKAVYDYSIRNVGTIAELRTIEGKEGQTVNLLGYYEVGDKNPLVYEWVTGVKNDDGGSVIVPNKGGGYWEAQFVDSVDVRDFGVFGLSESNDTININKTVAVRKNITSSIDNVIRIAEPFLVEGLSNISISNLNIIMTSSKTEAVIISRCENITFSKSKIRGAKDYSKINGRATGLMIRDSRNINVKNNFIYDFGNSAIRYSDSTDIFIHENTLMYFHENTNIVAGDNYCFAISTYLQTYGSKRVNINNNVIYGFSQGIHSSNVSEIVVNSNHISSVKGQHAIYLEPVNNCLVSGNMINDIAYIGIKIQVQASVSISKEHRNIGVVNNVITSCGQTGITISVVDNIPDSFGNVLVNGNIINDIYTGIYIRKCNEALITSNTIKDSKAYGVYSDLGSSKISDNIIKNTLWSGIACYNIENNIDISNNYLENIATEADASRGERNSSLFFTGNNDVIMRNNTYKKQTSNAQYNCFSTQSNLYLEGGNMLDETSIFRVSKVKSINNDVIGKLFGGNLPSGIIRGGFYKTYESNIKPTDLSEFNKGDIIMNRGNDFDTLFGWVVHQVGSTKTLKNIDIYGL